MARRHLAPGDLSIDLVAMTLMLLGTRRRWVSGVAVDAWLDSPP